MDSMLIKKIDELEEAHQEIKRRWIAWARDRYPDRGIGSQHNSHTDAFLKKEGSDAVAVLSHLKQDISNEILKIKDPKQKYLVYRELYLIHPSFHEHWLLFDLHLELSAKKIISGRGGLNRFLKNPVQKPADLKTITTYSLRRLILIENLLSGRMELSLFDETPMPDKKIPTMAGKFDKFSQMKIQEKVEAMPDIFSIVLALLEKTNYHSLDPGILLSDAGWLYWAQCCINEGPIIKKTHPKSRVEIFKRISSVDPTEFHKEIEKYYQIIPVGIETGLGTVLPNPCIDLNNIQPLFPISNREKAIPNVKVNENIQLSSTLDANSELNLYKLIREELDPLFGKSVFPQKIKFTYRGTNEIEYPKKTELDMISLFKPPHQYVNRVRFRIYPYVLASHIGLIDTNGIFNALPAGVVLKQEKENPHPAEIFFEGYFSNMGEIERFVKWLMFGRD